MSFIIHPSFFFSEYKSTSIIKLRYERSLGSANWQDLPLLYWHSNWAVLFSLPNGLHWYPERVVTLFPLILGHNSSCLFHPWRATQLVCRKAGIIFMINEGFLEVSPPPAMSIMPPPRTIKFLAATMTRPFLLLAVCFYFFILRFGYISLLHFLFDSRGFTAVCRGFCLSGT